MSDPSVSFEIFHEEISKLIDENVPTKRITKKMLRTSGKPWITPAIKRSITRRDQLYKEYIQSKTAENEASQIFLLFKHYRNEIVKLVRQSKCNHNQQYFAKNLKNSKNIWKGIHDLINMKKDKTDVNKISLNINGQNTTDLKRVADEFNSYFTSVADEIREKIPQSKKDFKSYLRNRTRNSLFFSPITKDKVLKTIKLLDLTKSTGPCILSHKLESSLNH